MRTISEPLVSNGFLLEMTPERLGWLEASDADLIDQRWAKEWSLSDNL
jgi:hypothetical protein